MFVKNRDLFYYYDINYLRSKYELYQADSNGKIVKHAQTEDRIEAKFSLQMPFFYQFDGILTFLRPTSIYLSVIHKRIKIVWLFMINVNRMCAYLFAMRNMD